MEGKLVEQMVRRHLLDNPNKDKLAPQIEKVKVVIEDMGASARLMRISSLVAHPAATDVLIFRRIGVAIRAADRVGDSCR